ncbi:MAG: immune inhibitor A [Chloroflexota bacterium]|nr:immune inhibitor A [Chloroflexota bacterium]
MTRVRYCILSILLLITGFTFASCNTALPARPTPLPFTPPALPTRTDAQQEPLPTATPIAATVLRTLSTVEQLRQIAVPARDLRALTLQLNPQLAAIPLVVNRTTPTYMVGDQLDFWVHNVDVVRNSQITAELVYTTSVAYVWVESGQLYDLPAIQRAIDRFSQQSYPAEVAFFGSESYPGVDNDPRLHILHTPGLGGGIAGYYSSADEYSVLARPFSNEKEMFYINLQWLNGRSDYTAYETVLAHELQHMIHWANDSNEETWLNEGLSEFAKEVTGYGAETAFVGAFVSQPDTQLNTWNADTGRNGVHYGSAYLFVHYLNQRFGAAVTKPLVANPANGIAGIDAVLKAAGFAETFDTVFADWVVANFANDATALGLDGVYGYQTLPLSKPVLDQAYTQYPVALQQSTVNNYATDYIQLAGTGDIVIDFSGQTATRLTNTDAHSGEYAWWGNRADSSTSTLTRAFDLRSLSAGTPVELEVALWWDIETDYDYGYVLASRDGQKWQILPGQRTITTNPSGNSFGAGYTNRSLTDDGATHAWVTERFDLTAYAGQEIQLRFAYVTDDATNGSGWLIDDVRIPALGYAADFEGDVGGWASNGWLLTDNVLPQRWLLQVMEFTDAQVTNVRRVPVDAAGRAQIDVNDLANGKSAVLAISALTPVTTEPAAYEFEINQK